MSIYNWISLIGGIGLFLYGMNVLGGAIESFAGAKLEKTLEKLASTRIRGMLLGMGVTAVIQSSAATSIMAIGFINAGIMSMEQGVSVMLGSNIGTTITGQILRLSDLSGNQFLTLINPSTIAPLFIAAGAGIRLMTKREKQRNIASIMIGFGVIFVGMSMIEEASAPLSQSESIHELFAYLNNPLIALLVGMVITSILQSASASVGILQAVSVTGQITMGMAIPMVVGMNIGKFVPIVLSSLGTNHKARRAVLVNILVMITGSLIFLAALMVLRAAPNPWLLGDVAGRGNIANFNTIFNLSTTFLLFPAVMPLVSLAKRLIPGEEESRADRELARLDDTFLATPSIAIEQCFQVVVAMGEAAVENIEWAASLLGKYNDAVVAHLDSNEQFLDKAEATLGEYMMKVNSHNLDEEQTQRMTLIMHALGDFERIGDYCVNIAEVAEYNAENKIEFSEVCKYELRYLMDAVHAITDLTLEALRKESEDVSRRVEPLEETIDSMIELLKQKHIDRLKRGECGIQRGISFMEVLTNVERISDHCSNIAVHTWQRVSHTAGFNPHEELESMHKGNSEEYSRLFNEYTSIFLAPVADEQDLKALRTAAARPQKAN